MPLGVSWAIDDQHRGRLIKGIDAGVGDIPKATACQIVNLRNRKEIGGVRAFRPF
jgi:hypothetical protein